MTIKEALDFGKEKLKNAGIDDFEYDTKEILAKVTGLKPMDFFLHYSDELSEEDEILFYSLIDKRSERIPLQLLFGTQEFMGYSFGVSKNVLIPRIDTETLCEEAEKLSHDNMRFLDICTGTGCIPIALVKRIKGSKAIGIDISDDAIALSRKNAADLGADCLFYQGDLYDALPSELPEGFSADGNREVKFDMIISNPPYIKSSEIENLMPEVKDHEPHLALDGGDDGLIFYRRITKDAGTYLKNRGILMFEIGYDEGQAVRDIMKENGFKEIFLKKDLAGNDRVVGGYFY